MSRSWRCAGWVLLLGLALGCGRLGFNSHQPDGGGGPGADGGGDAVAALDGGEIDGSASPDASPPVLLPPAVSATADPFSTGSDAFTDVPGATLTVDASDPEIYWLLLVSARLTTEADGLPGVEARYLVDGVERGMGGIATTNAPRSGSFTHFDLIAPGSGSRAVQVQLRQLDTSGAMATLDGLGLVAMPLGPSADPIFIDDMSDIAVDMPDNRKEYTVPVGSAGEYLLLAVVNLKRINDTGSVASYFVDPINDGWGVSSQQTHVEVWQTMMDTQVAMLPAGDQIFAAGHKTFSFSGGVGGVGTLRNPRIVAFRTDAFASVDHAEMLEQQVVDSPDTTITALTSTPPAGIRQQVVIQRMHAQVDCGFTGLRRPSFVTGGAILEFPHAYMCAYKPTYGLFRLVPGDQPITFENRLSAAQDGQTATAFSSRIRVLGLL